MIYTFLGRTGLKISKVALGTWQFGSRSWGYGVSYGRSECVMAVRTGVEYGINLIDTAEVYGSGLSEEIVGEAIRGMRERVMIATKVSPTHLSYNGTIKACERSLRRLGVKSIDLYQVHWPNPLIPISQTMRAMEKLVEMGKISYIGVSNFSKKLLVKAQETLRREEIVSDQVKYNLLERGVEDELLPYAEKEGITILAYSPLAQGLLTGKYSRANPPRDVVRKVNILFDSRNMVRLEPLLTHLNTIADRNGATSAQIALRWLISRDRVVAIAGVKNSIQAAECAAAAEASLSPEDHQLLDKLSRETQVSRGWSYLRVLGRLLR
ncbi:MAG: aldo/keto reductase [Nitrososphaerota archaeon]